MEVRTLTPSQIWQDEDVRAFPLDINIISRVVTDGVETSVVGFTALKVAGERVRCVLEITRKENAGKTPVLISIHDYDSSEQLDISRYVEEGFAVIRYDYARGITYPESIAYADIDREDGHLCSAKYGAKETSAHIWSKIAIRVVSVVEELPYLDADAIAMTAWGRSAEIIWQVAAVDERVKVIVPALNSGWREYRDFPKYGDKTPEFGDEAIRWNIGCSVQAYAKFVKADVLFLGASNNADFSFDRLEDTFNLLPEGTAHHAVISAGMRNQIYDNTESVIRYLKAKFSDKPLIKSPEAELFLQEGKMRVSVDVDATVSDISEVDVYYAYGESNPVFRNWIRASVGVGMDGKGTTAINVYDKEERIYLFVNATYRHNVNLSSTLHTVIPSSLGEIKESVKPRRIIYERKMGTGTFVCVQGKKLVEHSSVKLVTGPLDIVGITVDAGDLVTYAISDAEFCGADAVLQFDVYSDCLKEISISVIDSADNEYLAKKSFISEGEWAKVQLELCNFKDADMLPLKSWDDVKGLRIYNAAKMLVNNILIL